MLTDLAKCVLTLLSSPAPGGGPRSQGLRAQQEWVSAAEGQPQTSLGVERKGVVAQAPRHTKEHTNDGGGDPHRRQHTGVRREGKYRHYGGGWGGAIAWPTLGPTAHAIEETPQQARTQ